MKESQHRHHGKTAAESQDGDVPSPFRPGNLALQCLALSSGTGKKGKNQPRRPPPVKHPNRQQRMQQMDDAGLAKLKEPLGVG